MEEGQLQNLLTVANTPENVRLLRLYARSLTSHRNNILRSLEKTANHIEHYPKYGSISRFIFSASGIAGTVVGLCMEYCGCKNFKYAFYVSAACGILNVISSVTELFLFENKVKDIIRILSKYKSVYSQIHHWPQESEALHRKVLILCPFDCLTTFIRTAEDNLSTVAVLVFCLKIFKNMTEEQNQIFRNSCEWLIFNSNPLVFDAARAGLQLRYSPVNVIIFQYVPVLPKKEQNFFSVPVLGRISLNYATMLRAGLTLMKCEMSDLASEMRSLYNVFEDQMNNLERILEITDLRLNHLGVQD